MLANKQGFHTVCVIEIQLVHEVSCSTLEKDVLSHVFINSVGFLIDHHRVGFESCKVASTHIGYECFVKSFDEMGVYGWFVSIFH